MPVVVTLEINLVGDNPRTDIVDGFGSGVAVRDKRTFQTERPGLLEYGHGPLGSDEGLVVAGDDQLCFLALSQGGELSGGHGLHRRVGCLVA